MPLRLSLLVLTAVTIFTILPAAQATAPNVFGRHLGIGWSDGYHSHAACPPKHRILHHKQTIVAAPADVPWWKIPAVESVPPGEATWSPHNGPTLLRQPGEGSSVVTPKP